ncbi:hypothetical protein LTR86_008657 [Recurvomyces mirabilis]|nr:hypothetical protein LTR86_008657 [Recurvomyces mirabilis]
MATNTTDQQHLRFLDLPGELRDKIYHLVLDDRRMNRVRPTIEHPLVRTCCQIRNEALVINDAGTILPLFPACHDNCPNSCRRPRRPSLLLTRMGPNLVRRIGQMGFLFRPRYWMTPNGWPWGYEPTYYDSELRAMRSASMIPFGNGMPGVSAEFWRYDIRDYLQRNGFELRVVREKSLLRDNIAPDEWVDWQIMFMMGGEAGRPWLW